MKWSILIGVLSALVIWLVAMMMHDWSVVYQISGSIGVTITLLATIVSGVLGYGSRFSGNDRMRANYRYEDQKDRYKRLDFATKLLMIGLPNLVTTILCVLYMHPPFGN
jgi:hypothetical protein